MYANGILCLTGDVVVIIYSHQSIIHTQSDNMTDGPCLEFSAILHDYASITTIFFKYS